MEKNITVAIQGIRGSYHHVAVEKFFGQDAEYVECATFKQVPEALEKGQADYGVMAIENSIAGSLLQNHKDTAQHNHQSYKVQLHFEYLSSL